MVLVLNSFSIADTNNYSELEDLNTELDQILNTFNLNQTQKFWFLTLKLIHSTMTNLPVNTDVILECEKFLSTIDINILILKDNWTITMIYAYNLYYKARIFVEMHKWDEAFNAFTLALELTIKIKNQFSTFSCYYWLVNYYIWRDNLNKSLETIHDQISYFKSLENHKYVISCYSHLSIIYLEKSNNLHKSLEASELAIKEFSLINDNSEGNLGVICDSLTNKANVLKKMGKYTESIQIYNEILPYATKKRVFDNGNALAIWNINVSKIYEEMGEFEKALRTLEVAFEILTKSKYHYSSLLPETYYLYISVYLKHKKVDKAELKIQEFSKIINELKKEKYNDNKIYFSFMRDIQAFYNVAQAFLLINKRTMIANSRAQILLQDVVSEYLTKRELLIKALILLIDLETQEYKLFEKSEILEDIILKSKNLQILIEGFNSIPLKIQVLILQAKLDIISNKISHYEELMNAAKQLAIEYDIIEQKELIELELANFNDEIRKWESIISTPVKNRLINTELEDYIKKMSQIVNE